MAWLANIGRWFLSFLLSWIADHVRGLVTSWLEKRKRAKEQKESTAKLEQDVQEGKPRNDETRKNEEDYLND